MTKIATVLTLALLSSTAFAQQTGLLRCEDGKGGVTYVEKFCPTGYIGVKDVRSATKTEAELQAELNKPANTKKTLTEGQARACVGRKNEVAAMKKRLTSMEVGPKYDAFAKRVEDADKKYHTDCVRER